MAATRIRTVCLDFDQTLGYIAPSHFALYVAAARECGLQVTEEALRARPLTDAWARWMTPLGPDHSSASRDEASFRAVREELHAIRLGEALATVGSDRGLAECDDETLVQAARRIAELECQPEHYRLYDDALPALERLARAGVQAVIVSNHVWRLPEIVRALGCGARFEGVVTSARAGYRKPHPEIFRAAVRLAGTPPELTLMVGDSLRDDVEGARRVGMPAVLLDRSGSRPSKRCDEHVIHSLLEIPLQWT
jgi:HAD superfamily hydrolase (TIGR01509 family)